MCFRRQKTQADLSLFMVVTFVKVTRCVSEFLIQLKHTLMAEKHLLALIFKNKIWLKFSNIFISRRWQSTYWPFTFHGFQGFKVTWYMTEFLLQWNMSWQLKQFCLWLMANNFIKENDQNFQKIFFQRMTKHYLTFHLPWLSRWLGMWLNSCCS